MDCIFCKIVKGEIPSSKILENDKILAFRDINPQAPVHILIVPKIHIDSVDNITPENSDYISTIFEVIPEIAKKEGLENGYRVVTNIGKHGCQSVRHLHFHIIGGTQLTEKMS